MYTSGSTGQPKGVVISHAALHNLVTWSQREFQITADDRGSVLASQGFDPWTLEVLPLITRGGALCIPDFELPIPPAQLRGWLLVTRITIVPFLVTPLAEELLGLDWPADTPFRLLTTGGDRLKLRPPPGLPFAVCNGYGPTENTVYSTYAAVTAEPPPHHRLPSIGRPIANTRAYVLDRHHRPVPVGVAGELYLAGANLADGYLNRAELTERRFVADPFSTAPGARMYMTGDLVRYLPDGEIDYLGRTDHQIKILGFRIELGEIEGAIQDTSTDVAQAIVVVHDRGGHRRVVAYLRLDGTRPADACLAELRDALPRRLPRPMVPSAFVIVPAFPLTTSGKVDRRALPYPEETRQIDRARTATEEILCAIWADLLELDAVGIDESFFALGGHSLHATRLGARIAEVFGVQIALSALFQAQTVAAQATLVDEHRASCGDGDGDGDAPALPVVPAPWPADARIPLSPGQKRLWFLHAMNLAGTEYNVVARFMLAGALDADTLEAALGDVVERQGALRARFGALGGEPYQVIEPYRALRLDRRACPADRALVHVVDELLAHEARRPFALASAGDPLARFFLVTSALGQAALVINIHHIVFDGWSLGVLLHEVSWAYAARRGGAAPTWDPLPAQYADFVSSQAHWLGSSLEAAQLAHWQDRLRDLPPLLLPADHHRPPGTAPSPSGTADVTFAPALVGALDALCRRDGATLFMVALAAYCVLLHRYTQQDDLAIATPIANRNVGAFDGVIGLFGNTLLLRCDASEDPSFRTLLRRVRTVALEAYQHQDLPFDRLVSALAPARGADPIPLVQAVLTLHNASEVSLALDGVAPARADYRALIARCALELHLFRFDGQLRAQLVYDTTMFEPATAARLGGHFARILEAVARDAEIAISRIPLLDPAETAEIVRQGRALRAPVTASVHALVADQCRQRPDHIALVCEGHRVTYRALDDQARRLAQLLRRRGVARGVAVAIYMTRDPAMIVALLAILKAGGFYVPLDPDSPAERNDHILADVGVALTLCLRRRPFASGAHPVIVVDDVLPSLADDGSADDDAITPDDLCYVTYTSGSTGLPKGVSIPHRGVVRLVKDTNYVRLDPRERVLFLGLLAFDVSTFEIWGALLNGATLVIATPERPALADLGRLLRDEAVTTAAMPTGFFHLFLQERPEDLAVLRQILAGGDVLRPDAAARALAGNPELTLINSYGPTENTSLSCCFPMHGAAPSEGGVPIGRAISGTWVYVLDRHGEIVPFGAVGELYTGGDGLAHGYWNQLALTDAKFPRDPFADTAGARMFRTGDLVRMRPDGVLEFLGRNDGMVKVRGFRIEIGEVERALTSHPDVHAAVVLALVVGGEKQLVAYVVPAPQRSVAADAVRAHLRGRLPEYMVPAELIAIPAVPLTARGKLDRSQLPAPSPERRVAARPAVSPDELEVRIAAIWREVLQRDDIDRHDTFFEVGGHSLLVMQLCDRLDRALATKIAPVTIFEHPTIHKLAAHLAGPRATDATPSPAIARAPSGAVAIVGMAGRFPGARDLATFWHNLASGVDSISAFTDAELREFGVPDHTLHRPDYVKRRGRLDAPFDFDAEFFRIGHREAELMDPQHRLFLECAHQALEDAGYDPLRHAGAIGVYGGCGDATYLHYLLRHADADANTARDSQIFLGNYRDCFATRVAYKLGLKGPAVNVQSACSTSLVAVVMAAQALRDRHCDLVLAGGAAICMPSGYVHEPGGVMSPDGHCRAFDRRAQGTVSGDGASVVVLKRLEDALADRDTIHAVIRGFAINNDGFDKVGYTAPSVDGQARVIHAALEMAGGEVEDITYVEAHGTGTALGDPIEIKALTQAFRRRTPRTQFCAIGSVKTNIGHLDAAAGIAGLVKTVLALEHGQLPPSLHFEAANPALELATSPFVVQDRLAVWPRGPRPRRAGVSSFGVGGTNAHVIVEQAPAAAPAPLPARPCHLLVFSARTPADLDQICARTVDELAHASDVALADAAFTLQIGRREHAHRRIVVCRSHAELRDRLPHAATAQSAAPSIAFLFSGQGAQYAGMSRGLYAHEPVFRAAVDECCEILRPRVGEDLRALIYADTESARSHDTCVVQPMLFVVEHAIARLLASWGIRPAVVLGHSVGEIAAAQLAGVFGLEDALALVAARGQLMQAMPHGAMLALDASADEARALLARTGHAACVAVAAENAPMVTVLAGPREAIAAIQAAWEREGRTAHHVNTSHAFHSPLMDGCLDAFRDQLARVTFRAPALPIISNLTGDWVRCDEICQPAYWVRHLRETVQFSAGVRRVLADPDRVVVEIGPGNTLAQLAARHLGDAERDRAARMWPTLPRARDARDDEEVLHLALGGLWQAGVAVDWSAVQAGRPVQRRRLAGYPLARQRLVFTPSAPRTTSAPLAKQPEIADWFYLPTWRAQPLAEAAPAPTGTWIVLADADRAPGEAGRAWLADAGARAIVVAPGDDLDAVLADAAGDARLVYLGGLTPGVASTRSAYDYYQDLLAITQAIGRRPSAHRFALTVVTNHQHIVRPGERLCPDKAALLGTALVIALEYPNVRARCIDVGAGDMPWPQIAAEIAHDTDDAVVAYRDGQRMVRGFAAHSTQPRRRPRFSIKPGGVHLITGGLGGVGFQLAEHLITEYQARVIVTGASALALDADAPDDAWFADPDPEPALKRDRLRRLRALAGRGGEIVAVQADVTDEARMRDLLADVRHRFGRIDGVIHAAMTLRDGLMQRKPPEAALAAMRPKIEGAKILDRLLADQPPDFVVVCSSLTALVGGYGQSDYAAANAVLDAWAEDRAAAGRPWLSINWGTWRDAGGATRTVAARLLSEVAPRPVTYPLFACGYRVHAGRAVYGSRLSVDRDWVVAEHRVQGVATVPGTALIEMASAAVSTETGWPALELYDVYLFELLRVPDAGAAFVRTVLEAHGDDWAFTIESLTDDAGPARWKRHAAGHARALARTTDLPRVDRAHLVAACPDAAALTIADGPITVGPRWQRGLAGARFGHHQALADLALADEHADDTSSHPLHPALLDVALGFALGAGRPYMPYRYGSVKLWRPLPARFACHARYRADTRSNEPDLAYDITLFDDRGEELARISDYHLKPVPNLAGAPPPGAPPRPCASRPTPLDLLAGLDAAPELAQGMTAAEGVEALCRVLDHGFVHTAISPQALDAVIADHRAGHAAPTAARAPRAGSEEIERVLAEVWRDVLGIAHIDPRASFFDLHGDSLLAIKMVSRLRERLGVDLIPNVLFENPTFDHLLRHLRDHSAPGAKPPSSVVAIRNSDDGVPTFFVHPVGGGVLCYAGLAARWPGCGAFYGLQARGIEDGAEPLTTIEDMAEAYIEALKGVQPRGPYRLGGWSLGGTIAFEMTRRLQARGDTVEQLVLIDSTSPTTERQADGGPDGVFAALVQDQRGLEGLHEAPHAEVDAAYSERLLRVFQANYAAWLRYHCDEPVHAATPRALAFIAQDRDPDAAAIEVANWRRALPRQLEAHVTPGGHYSILQGANLDALAAKLGHELTRTSE
jgi:amino acid adenylation domain-containing protein